MGATPSPEGDVSRGAGKELWAKAWMMPPGPDSVMRSTEQKNTPRTTQEWAMWRMSPDRGGFRLRRQEGRNACHVLISRPSCFPRPSPSSKLKGRGSP